jgi:hypothetical protein
VKPSAQRRIHEGDTAVRCVHRPEDVEILRYAKLFVAVGKSEFDCFVRSDPLARLDQCNQLTKNFGDIPAIDFIDYTRM